MYKRVNELLGTNFESNENINWVSLPIKYKLSEDFIREFRGRVSWKWVVIYQSLSESFIREFKERVNWRLVSSFQILSEKFIREFEDRVDWEIISQRQLLSWKFILEFEDRVEWDLISEFQPFIDPEYEKIDEWYLERNKLYHLYQKTKDKGWFVGYVKPHDLEYFSPDFLDPNYSLKTKIHWKDLLTIDRIRLSKSIREVKYV